MRKKLMTVALAAFFSCCLSNSTSIHAEESMVSQESTVSTTEFSVTTTEKSVVSEASTQKKKTVVKRHKKKATIKKKHQEKKKSKKDNHQKQSKPKISHAPGSVNGYKPVKAKETEYVGQYIHYNQTDTQWNQNNLSIRSSGCGPTSMAVCIANLQNKSVTPVDTASWARQQGLYSSDGSVHKAIPAMAQHWGLHCMGLKRDYNMIKRSLQNENPVVGLMGPGYFTGGGHFITLLSIDQNDKVVVADVASRKRTSKKYDLKYIIAQSKQAAANGPFWSIYKSKAAYKVSAKAVKKKIKKAKKVNTVRAIKQCKKVIANDRTEIEKNIPVEKLIIGQQASADTIPSGKINDALYDLGEQLENYELIYVSTHYEFGQQMITGSNLKANTIDVNEILDALQKKGR